mmetsp:Transcript_2885/g.3756  ORF Transcript_2885/g.3756 Transcript_2885/m.3756 type:complete len:109 (-) Transcript_2885:225-551(-)
MMRLFLAIVSCLLAPTFAFINTATSYQLVTKSNNVALKMADEGRINTKIDLDSPKVATMQTLEPGSKCVYCRCWKSDTFPLCDGKHMDHNKATGDNVGPLIVDTPKAD